MKDDIKLHTMPLKLEALFASQRFRMLEWDEKGAYLLLLCEAWLKGGLIEASSQYQARLLGIHDKAAFDRIKTSVIDVFFKKTDDGLSIFNETQLTMIHEVYNRSRRLSEAGKKGHKAKVEGWLKGGLSQAEAGLKPGSSISVSQYPSISVSHDKHILAPTNSGELSSLPSADIKTEKANGELNEAITETREGGMLLDPTLDTPPTPNRKQKAVSVEKITYCADTQTWKNIKPEDLQGWAAAYPACDIDRQLLRMLEWLKSNPKKAVKRNYRAFITNWLSKSQSRGGDIQSNRPREQERTALYLDQGPEYKKELDASWERMKAQQDREVADAFGDR